MQYAGAAARPSIGEGAKKTSLVLAHKGAQPSKSPVDMGKRPDSNHSCQCRECRDCLGRAARRGQEDEFRAGDYGNGGQQAGYYETMPLTQGWSAPIMGASGRYHFRILLWSNGAAVLDENGERVYDVLNPGAYGSNNASSPGNYEVQTTPAPQYANQQYLGENLAYSTRPGSQATSSVAISDANGGPDSTYFSDEEGREVEAARFLEYHDDPDDGRRGHKEREATRAKGSKDHHHGKSKKGDKKKAHLRGEHLHRHERENPVEPARSSINEWREQVPLR